MQLKRQIFNAGSYFGLVLIALTTVSMVGCYKSRRELSSYPQAEPSRTFLNQIEYPDLCDECGTDGNSLMTGPPVTYSNFHELEPWDLTLDECVLMALSGSKVMQRLGGVVVNSPQAATTTLDPALIETNPLQSVEAALSAFDAQASTSFFFNHSERTFNNLFFGGGAASLTTDASTFQAQLQKTTATGATLTLRNQVDYNRNDSPANLFGSTYDILNFLEARQPIGRGSGSLFNRIAGPNALPGQYNGVLLARIRSDVSLADFESAVRDLVRDVETNYWELYFAYRNLDTNKDARDAIRATWENRKLRLDGGLDRPDDEAQARQQFFNFENQVITALAGTANGQLGLIGAERNLRRLLGLKVNDGRVIRPATEPVTTPIIFDWEDSQGQALDRRVELRRQKWIIRQRELELIAAKDINRWQFDLVGQYGFRGFGDNLFGSRSRPNGSAFDDLINGDLDDWQLGFELGGPIGLRQGHLAVRSAELNLNREKTVLHEQQRQILHDLSAATVEIDRAFLSLKANANNRIAIEEELIPKRRRFDEGEDQIFFLLDVQQRLANVESAVHRSIADYNQALLNHSFSTGSLLGRFNIFLTEGPWEQRAHQRAGIKAAREVDLGPNVTDGRGKLSKGAYNQSKPGPATLSQYTNQIDSPQDLPAEVPEVEGELIENDEPVYDARPSDVDDDQNPDDIQRPLPDIEDRVRDALDANSR